MFWDASYYGSHGGTAVDGPRTRWLFAEGSEGFFNTFVLLANSRRAASDVTLTFLREGSTPFTKVVTVPPTRARDGRRERHPRAGRPVVLDRGRRDGADHRRARDVLRHRAPLRRRPRIDRCPRRCDVVVPRRRRHRPVLRDLRPDRQPEPRRRDRDRHVPYRHRPDRRPQQDRARQRPPDDQHRDRGSACSPTRPCRPTVVGEPARDRRARDVLARAAVDLGRGPQQLRLDRPWPRSGAWPKAASAWRRLSRPTSCWRTPARRPPTSRSRSCGERLDGREDLHGRRRPHASTSTSTAPRPSSQNEALRGA